MKGPSDKAVEAATRDSTGRIARDSEVVISKQALEAAYPIIIAEVVEALRTEFLRERDEQMHRNIDNANAMHYALDVLDAFKRREFGGER